MKKDFNFKNVKVGDKVYDVILGWDEVTDNDGCAFEVRGEHWFNYDGKQMDEDENPTIYPYNPFEQNQERVIEVSNSLGWKEVEAITIHEGIAVIWNDEKTNAITYPRGYWREIKPKVELTQEEKINILWDKYGKEL